MKTMKLEIVVITVHKSTKKVIRVLMTFLKVPMMLLSRMLISLENLLIMTPLEVLCKKFDGLAWTRLKNILEWTFLANLITDQEIGNDMAVVTSAWIVVLR